MSSSGGSDADGEERITAAAAIEALLARGLRREDLLHGSTVIGAFLGPGYARLVELTGAQELTTAAAVREAAWADLGEVEITLLRMPFGAPATAVVMEEYRELGTQKFLFVGAAGSLQPQVRIGSLVIPTEAAVSEGTSRHYGVDGSTVPCPSPHLTQRLAEACRRLDAEPHMGRHWTTDAPYRELVGDIRRHKESGVLSVDMEVSAIFSVARFRGLDAAVVLAISDEVFGPWNPGFTREEYRKALSTAAEAALDVAKT